MESLAEALTDTFLKHRREAEHLVKMMGHGIRLRLNPVMHSTNTLLG